MANLQDIWIEANACQKPALRFDWDNDRHQRIEIQGRNPVQVINSLRMAAAEIEEELFRENI